MGGRKTVHALVFWFGTPENKETYRSVVKKSLLPRNLGKGDLGKLGWEFENGDSKLLSIKVLEFHGEYYYISHGFYQIFHGHAVEVRFSALYLHQYYFIYFRV